MRQITIESQLSQQLAQAVEQAAICDEQGRVLGLFSPLPTKPQLSDLQLEPPLSIEETERLRATRTGKPLEEILSRLRH